MTVLIVKLFTRQRGFFKLLGVIFIIWPPIIFILMIHIRSDAELNRLLKEYRILNETVDKLKEDPLLNGEEVLLNIENNRRQMMVIVKEYWRYLNTELRKIKNETVTFSPRLASKLENMIQEATEHKRLMHNSLEVLQSIDKFEAWRLKEFNDLSDLVQRRFEHFQNPKDCSKARKLICRIHQNCGFGCQLHHVTYCFIVAYSKRRTLILESKGWSYAKGGWEEVFEPLSKTCTSCNCSNASPWPGSEETQHIHLPHLIGQIHPRPPQLPLSIPKDLEPRLSRIHGDPIEWWIGQILKYLLKPQPKTKDFLKRYSEKINFKTPVVGIHVRRTDKIGTEASFHDINEYMAGVEEYYKELALKQPVKEKRVYVATDDPQVLADIKGNFSDYIVLGDSSNAKLASNVTNTRYSESSLMGLIADIHFLSLSDYLVCTFSSQICRVVYEIMNSRKPDASLMYNSLDDIYYFCGQLGRIHCAIVSHSPNDPSEIELMVGDEILVAGNHWNGYSIGTNQRTGQRGFYPSYKVVNRVETAEFPTYPEVPLLSKNSK